MAPKGKKASGSTEKQKLGEEEREEILQAVVLTDSFENRFRPFTYEKPRCLLPLANTPLIDYTFEFLANAGVSEVYVYCGAHADQVEDYINNSRWIKSPVPFTKLEILKSASHSVGDTLRDLDKRALLSGDFVLVYGDVISNYSLDSAIAAHRARKINEKDAIMTMVLRESGEGAHRTKAHDYTPSFVIDPSVNRCLHYEQVRNYRRITRNGIGGSGFDSGSVNIEAELIQSNTRLEIRQDLIDCGVDICTPDALALWSDNFDYEAPRSGFLHSVLKDHELNGKTVHVHIIKESQQEGRGNGLYAARVRNLAAYDAISRDVVGRWAYPLCPDSNLRRGQTYVLRKNNVYEEEGVMLSRSCVVEKASVVGKDSVIGDGSVVTDSVIGTGVTIGKNVILDGAYIWDYSAVGDSSVVRSAIVADEASVGKNCRVEAGALVSFKVVVPNNSVVKGSSKLSKAGGEGEDGYRDLSLEGSDDEDEPDMNSLTSGNSLYDRSDLAISDESISTLNSELSSGPERPGRMDRGSFASTASDESQAGGKHAKDFYHDASAIISESLSRNDEPTNIQLELTALRMGTNASEHQVRRAVVTAFMKRVSQLNESGKSVKEATTATFGRYGSLITRTVFDKNRAEKSDQVDFLLLMQADLSHRREGDSILLFAANELYTMDVLEADAFEQWWRDEKSTGTEKLEETRTKMGQFMEVLLADSDEESDEEEEDDDDASG